MAFTILIGLSSPMTWMVIMMIIAAWHRRFRKPDRKPQDAARIINSGATTPDAMGSALMFLYMAYRPNHSFVAKAQIVEREDTDEDDQGTRHPKAPPDEAVATDQARRTGGPAGLAPGMNT